MQRGGCYVLPIRENDFAKWDYGIISFTLQVLRPMLHILAAIDCTRVVLCLYDKYAEFRNDDMVYLWRASVAIQIHIVENMVLGWQVWQNVWDVPLSGVTLADDDALSLTNSSSPHNECEEKNYK